MATGAGAEPPLIFETPNYFFYLIFLNYVFFKLYVCGYVFVICVVDIFCVPKAIPPAPTAAMAIF